MDNTQRTKILYVITKSNWGGAQRYVYDMAVSLDKSLYEVEVVAGGNGLLKSKLEEAGIPVMSLDTMQRDVNLKNELLSAKELFKIFRKKKPDIVHLNSSKAGGIGALAARVAGVKNIIFTAHAWAFNENREIFSKIIISILHWITVIMSHRTIAVSSSVKEQVAHMPFTKKKIRVIHLGMDPFEMVDKEAARNIIRNSTAILDLTEKHSEKWIGTIAELHPVKGLLYAIDAMALIKDKYPSLHFYIIGEGEQRGLLEKQIKKRRLDNRVHLAGFIDEAKTLMKAFDIFILPSLSEAFGYTLIEAGIANVPVVATSVGGIPEVIEEKGILVAPKNAKNLADGLEKILSSATLSKRLANGLNKRVKEEFSVEKMFQKTLDVYKNNG